MDSEDAWLIFSVPKHRWKRLVALTSVQTSATQGDADQLTRDAVAQDTVILLPGTPGRRVTVSKAVGMKMASP